MTSLVEPTQADIDLVSLIWRYAFDETLVSKAIMKCAEHIARHRLSAERTANEAANFYAARYAERCGQLAVAQARIEALKKALVEEREENLWSAYHSGHVRDGRWTHMFMSDGEWLARQCGFDPTLPDYDDAAIRAAIPIAARAALSGRQDQGDS